jgi:phenylacetate-CoA ligase
MFWMTLSSRQVICFNPRPQSRTGAAFPKSLQDEIKSRGVDAYQAFGTADLGLIALETPAREGMVVNEDLIMEIVRPGTGDPVAEGDVGEIIVTSLDPEHPWIRLALGDLTATLPGRSPCGRVDQGWDTGGTRPIHANLRVKQPAVS